MRLSLNIVAAILFASCSLYSFNTLSTSSGDVVEQNKLNYIKAYGDIEIAFNGKNVENIVEKKRKSDFPDRIQPYKKPRSEFLNTPQKNLVISDITYKGLEVQPIYGDDTQLDSGLWCYINPRRPEHIIIINGDNPIYEKMIEEFAGEYEDIIRDGEDFMIKSIVFLHENIKRLLEEAHLTSTTEEIVCRHFASLTLPFYAKILRKKRFGFRGTIQMLHAPFVDGNLKSTKVGHAWNMITFDDENKGRYFLDVYNRFFVCISSKCELDDREVSYITSKGVDEITLLGAPENSELLDWVKITLERFYPKAQKMLNFDDEDAEFDGEEDQRFADKGNEDEKLAERGLIHLTKYMSENLIKTMRGQ